MAEAEEQKEDAFNCIELGKTYEIHQWEKGRWIKGVFKAKGRREGLFSSDEEFAYLVTSSDYNDCLVRSEGEIVIKLSGENYAKWFEKASKKESYEIKVGNEWKPGKFKKLDVKAKRFQFRTNKGKFMWLNDMDGKRIRKAGDTQPLVSSTKADLSLPGFDVVNTTFDWNECTKIHISEEGSMGVLFCQAGEKIAVVKNGQMAVSEIFAYHFAKKIDIRLPSCRVISAGDHQEWWDAKLALATFAQRYREDQVPLSSFVHRLNREFLLMEFISGQPFLEAAEEYTHEQFVSMGKLLVFDLFMNNRDRLPCGLGTEEVSDEDRLEKMQKFGVYLGNADNIMMSNDGTIVGIDNETGLLSVDDGLIDYCEKCLAALVDALNSEGDSIMRKSLTAFFKFYQKEFSDNNWQSIQEGMRLCCNALSSLTPNDITEIHDMVANMVTNDGGMVWGELLSNLKVDSMIFTLENIFHKM